jgi:hypothetical protein
MALDMKKMKNKKAAAEGSANKGNGPKLLESKRTECCRKSPYHQMMVMMVIHLKRISSTLWCCRRKSWFLVPKETI